MRCRRRRGIEVSKFVIMQACMVWSSSHGGVETWMYADVQVCRRVYLRVGMEVSRRASVKAFGFAGCRYRGMSARRHECPRLDIEAWRYRLHLQACKRVYPRAGMEEAWKVRGHVCGES